MVGGGGGEREKREEEEAVNLLVGQAGSSCVRACGNNVGLLNHNKQIKAYHINLLIAFRVIVGAQQMQSCLYLAVIPKSLIEISRVK